ncbi:hypothetical protein [Bacteroides sp. 51]|uniref:hypothetical protein n=1 Tax=Bacteroides sp. 51 TaxID=2302938 RepID=UPI0013D769DA|nr:hypothetical protein [Bacteroides sp. 51]NDV81285.1 hypothetical protein [Bacteroides sp. 51]
MKRILLAVLLSTVLLSCKSLYTENVYVFDFTKYVSSGFIISPISEGFKYDPVSNITMEFKSGHLNGHNRFEGEKKSPLDNKPASWFNPTMDYMLEKLVNEAKKQGANGILNFKSEGRYNGNEYVYTLTGFAVNIKE